MMNVICVVLTLITLVVVVGGVAFLVVGIWEILLFIKGKGSE